MEIYANFVSSCGQTAACLSARTGLRRRARQQERVINQAQLAARIIILINYRVVQLISEDGMRCVSLADSKYVQV